MRRQVITGGAIVVISVASAAAYSIVQGKWFHPAQQSAGQAEAVNVAPGQKPEGVEATVSAWFAQGAAADTDAAAPGAPAQQSSTVAQAGAPRSVPERLAQAGSPPKPAIACTNP